MSSFSLSIWDLSWLPSFVVTEQEMTCSTQVEGEPYWVL